MAATASGWRIVRETLSRSYSYYFSSNLRITKISKDAKAVLKSAPRSQVHTKSCLHQQTEATGAVSRPWRLASAVCLERFPVVCQELNEIEQRYIDVLTDEELERSALSEHELSVAADRRRMAKKQSGEQAEDEEDDDDDGGDLLTALDLEDLATEELGKFQMAPSITDADEKDDRGSLHRKLADKLVLLVKCKLADRSVWMLPYGFREEEETMQDVARRALSEQPGGESLRAHFMGNAPVGFLKQGYSKAVQQKTGNAGVKVFFFKAQHMSGSFQLQGSSGNVEDYVWVSRDELGQYLDEAYLESVQKFILPV